MPLYCQAGPPAARGRDMGERGDVIGRQKVEKMEKMELNLDCVPADHRVIGIEISPQCLKESLVPPAVTKTWFGSAQRC